MDFLTLTLLILVIIFGLMWMRHMSIIEDSKFVEDNIKTIIAEMDNHYIKLIPIASDKYQFSHKGKLTKVLTEKQFVKAILKMRFEHHAYVLGPLYPQEFKMIKHPSW